MQMQIIRCTVQKSPKAKGAEIKETLPQEGVKIDMNRNKAIRKRLALRLEAPERMTFVLYSHPERQSCEKKQV